MIERKGWPWWERLSRNIVCAQLVLRKSGSRVMIEQVNRKLGTVELKKVEVEVEVKPRFAR